MFIIKKIDRKTIVGVLLVFLLVVCVSVKFVFLSKAPSTAYCETVGSYYTEMKGDFSFQDFFRQFSIEVDENSKEETELTIPSVFNDVYENYNALQVSQGFDLANYKGEYVKRYTFDVVNDKQEYDVKANVLVFENKIIAGDLCTYAIDGTMTSLSDKTMIRE